MSFHRKKPGEPVTAEAARQKALRLLGRREHSGRQLATKLAASGVERADASELVESLASDGWQSDARYGAAQARSRVAQGYGPLRIRAELGVAGLKRDEVEAVMAALDADWPSLCAEAQARKCGALPENAAERARQWRQLAQRGFEAADIAAALRGGDEDAV